MSQSSRFPGLPRAPGFWLPALALCALLLLASAFGNIDHDEGQYVAAVALMRTGLPYRDFAYLQTPLQPLLFAPLAWLFEGWLFPALRAINALCASGAAILLFATVRKASGSDRAAIATVASLISCHTFLFAATVARNDALPLLLNMAGIWFMSAGLRGGNRASPSMFLMAGLALGAAASAKISYGLPAAAVGIFAILHIRRLGPGAVAALALGGVGGLLPTAFLFGLSQEAAWFGIIDYSLKAPFEWRTLNGQAHMVQWPLSLLRLLRFLAQGVCLLALGVLALSYARRSAEDNRTGNILLHRLLYFMILASLLAAWLPRPIYAQYLAPLLPPLLTRFGLMLNNPRWHRPLPKAVLIAFMLAGLAKTTFEAVPNLFSGHSPLFAAVEDAHFIGRKIREAKVPGAIVTLAPEHVIDSAIPIDRRFAMGPFVYRTQNLLDARQRESFHVTTRRSVADDLHSNYPAAIVAGTETGPPAAAAEELEAPMVSWARANAYQAIGLPSGHGVLFLRTN